MISEIFEMISIYIHPEPLNTSLSVTYTSTAFPDFDLKDASLSRYRRKKKERTRSTRAIKIVAIPSARRIVDLISRGRAVNEWRRIESDRGHHH